jgi:hypothetical protein
MTQSERQSMWVYRTITDGRTWERCEVLEGSIIWHAFQDPHAESYHDTYGNTYYRQPPTEGAQR